MLTAIAAPKISFKQITLPQIPSRFLEHNAEPVDPAIGTTHSCHCIAGRRELL
jgi:hypothetical protein